MTTRIQKLDIEGGFIIYDIIDEELENYMINNIDEYEWLSDISRRTQHYGWKYSYKNSSSYLIKALPFPDIFKIFIEKVKIDYNIKQEFNQMIINEYTIDQGISAHIDKLMFSNYILSLSLGEDTNYIMKKDGNKIELLIPRRSLLIMSEDFRYDWTHEIPKRKSIFNGKDYIKKEENYRRISATFREYRNL